MSNDSVVVPREPTEAMLNAGQRKLGDTAASVWSAMLSAAPQAADLRERVAKVQAALARVLPVVCVDTPDYAEMTFGESRSQAMTVEPDTFLALNDLPALLALLQPSPVEQKDG
ncbi:hypothetical protein IWC96_14675 [Brevundimonas sp. BAL450]|uniref:hypothetical protein n=1 Tax=Brevundimonas sp. BAL450 TaxID=1708162 RepID=UPI0018CBA265|nr:hypothetical protein [Brevundimonas sp. BAL450]MBG7616520.1 hypothetical protein [Brevundimonas sp. BAL450]